MKVRYTTKYRRKKKIYIYIQKKKINNERDMKKLFDTALLYEGSRHRISDKVLLPLTAIELNLSSPF